MGCFKFSPQVNSHVIWESHTYEDCIERRFITCAKRRHIISSTFNNPITSGTNFRDLCDDIWLIIYNKYFYPMRSFSMSFLRCNFFGCDSIHPIKSSSKRFNKFNRNFWVFSYNIRNTFFYMTNLCRCFGSYVSISFQSKDFTEFTKDRTFGVYFTEDFFVSNYFKSSFFQNTKAFSKLSCIQNRFSWLIFLKLDHVRKFSF